MRIPSLSAAIFFAVAASTSVTASDTRYASIVLVGDPPTVVHARNADDARRPASLAKLMTLYLTFEALERGDLGFGDGLRVSRAAAAQPAMKLGLTAGEVISVHDAVKALIVRSANDAAVVLAERLASDEAAFADLMNETAARLGMDASRFATASGLPHPDQVTTARDVARLTLAIRRDHPQYAPLFSLRAMEWDGAVLTNHNAVLYAVDGATGMKTGFTDAAGYHVAATATRNGMSVVAVVMGAASTRERTRHAQDLVNAAFEHAVPERPVVTLSALTLAEPDPAPLPRAVNGHNARVVSQRVN